MSFTFLPFPPELETAAPVYYYVAATKLTFLSDKLSMPSALENVYNGVLYQTAITTKGPIGNLELATRQPK
jgi:hypothetical protein